LSRFIIKNDILVDAETWPLLQSAGFKTLADFMNYPGGQRIVHKRGRSVFRFEVDGRAFYLKRNRVHWVELWKKFSRGKLPPRSARQEWESILAVKNAGIPTVTPIAFGEKTILGLETASFTLTEEIYGARPLDEIVKERFQTSGSFHLKREIIKKVADLARKLHYAGMNHQDFYLNHFFLAESGEMYLLDLQRVQSYPGGMPRHRQVKDLGQLNYSAQYYGGFTRSDRMRFLLQYLQQETLSPSDKELVNRITYKSMRIGRHDAKLLLRRRKRGELPPV